jgi:hypothetical protein
MDRVCEKGPILVNGKNLKKTSTTFGGGDPLLIIDRGLSSSATVIESPHFQA